MAISWVRVMWASAAGTGNASPPVSMFGHMAGWCAPLGLPLGQAVLWPSALHRAEPSFATALHRAEPSFVAFCARLLGLAPLEAAQGCARARFLSRAIGAARSQSAIDDPLALPPCALDFPYRPSHMALVCMAWASERDQNRHNNDDNARTDSYWDQLRPVSSGRIGGRADWRAAGGLADRDRKAKVMRY